MRGFYYVRIRLFEDRLLCHLHIQLTILLRGDIPGDVLVHVADNHVVPCFAVLEEQGLSSVGRVKKESGLISVKCEAVAFACVLVERLDCILEAAGLTNDRHCAVVHSDQLCKSARLKKHHMKQSMSRVAHCIDNGPMEGFWGILKRETYYGKRFTSRQDLVNAIESYIMYYNTERIQRNLHLMTPAEYHEYYYLAA